MIWGPGKARGFPIFLTPLRTIDDGKAGGFPQRPPNSMHPGCQPAESNLNTPNVLIEWTTTRQAVDFSDPAWKVDDIIYSYPTHFQLIPIISQQFSIHIAQLRSLLTQTWQKIQQEQLWPGLERNWFEACLLGHATGLVGPFWAMLGRWGPWIG